MKYIENPEKPVLTVMLQAKEPDEIVTEIAETLAAGTDAFGLQIEHLKPEHKTKEVYRRIFDAMQGKPAYVTNYRRGNNQPELTDDDLAAAVKIKPNLFEDRLSLHAARPPAM